MKASQYDPDAIFESIEDASTGLPPEDLYRARIEDLMLAALDKFGNPDSIADAWHIRETTAGLVLETAARRAGFVLGFEYCRDLLLSECTKGGQR